VEEEAPAGERRVTWIFGRREKPSLSICIIAQDSARDLEGLLKNVKGLGDEVVVVDGGSKDDTREVARQAGARVVEHPWPGHWGAQKNVAYDAAKGDWILNVDCDERVGDRLRERIPELIASRWRTFWKVPMYWLVEADKYLSTPQHYPCHVPRLFRNVPANRYVTGDGLCHPTFPKSARRGMKKVSGAHLFHLIFLRETREMIEAKMANYSALDERARETNEKYYPWWRMAHEVKVCEEGWTE
jgi:glycosyltransferase involved in cell wall biosynthesis